MPKLMLDRQTLSVLCNGNQQAIRAFEQMLEFVGSTAPDDMDALLALVSGVRSSASALNALDARLSALERQVGQRANLSAILARLDALEAQVARGTNLSALTARISHLEQLTGP
jgi:hypothetical protein